MKLLAVLMFCAAGLLSAQDEASTVYRLGVAIHEVENDNRVDTRNYTLLMKPGSKVTSRTGSRVPVAVGGESIQYVDVGANLDFRLHEASDNVRLDVDLELSDADQPPAGATQPTIRQVRYSVTTVVPVGKTTMIGKLDEPTGERRYEIEVTPAKVEQ